MSRTSLKEIVAYVDRTLKIAAFQDYPGACNGLQVENQGHVRKIAAAVDASFSTVIKAAQQGADLMVVHHGLFWSPSHPWTGRKYQLLRALIESDMAVYSAHLPLDAHLRWGNNARLAKALGFGRGTPFFQFQGAPIGLKFRLDLDRQELASRMHRVLGTHPVVLPGGPVRCRNIGVVTGGAGSELTKAAQEGIDTFITGEGPHWSFALAEDLGVNAFYGGHYATETFGVKAMAGALSKRFRLPWCFIDHPTGL